MERYYTAVVFAYVDPVRLHPVPTVPHWYWENKILVSAKDHVIGYCEGFKVRWSIVVYEFHKVSDKPEKIKKLHSYMQEDPVKYRGFLHHVNLYKGKTFHRQIKL